MHEAILDLSAFKAYDIRGRVPDQLNEAFAERLGRAFVHVTRARKVVVGCDIRLTSPSLTAALARGLMAAGADVYDIGLCGTEMVYFATFHYEMDGGIMVTASHNPQDYNGMKLVGRGSVPLSSDTGLLAIRDLMNNVDFLRQPLTDDAGQPLSEGAMHKVDCMAAYVQHLLKYVDVSRLKPLTLAVNAGNGGAGLVIDALESHLPFTFVKVDHEPNGHFPHGVPNPLLPENRERTRQAVLSGQADMGIAWDGDYDRCFLFDEHGNFIEGYYMVGLLAEVFLDKHPGARIIHDPRLTWNTVDVVEAAGGIPVQSKTGHAFIKQRMRDEDAVYGGEMSAHHYFRDFAYCDSGMIPWLLVAELVSVTGKTLGELVRERLAKFPASGEINRTIADPKATLSTVEAAYADQALSTEHVDGLSMEFADWRFNLRMSNTEPLVRLNVESRGDEALMQAKTAELLARLDQGE